MLLFLLFFLLSGIMPGDSLRQKFIYSSLALSALVVLVTEVLSSIQAFNTNGAAISWIVLFVPAAIVMYTNKNKIGKVSIWIAKTEYKYIAIVGIFLLLIFVEGIFYPPNNWDSLTYHMARVVHWINNQSVYPYVTKSYRQIYQSPFTEYFIGHIFLLHGKDNLSFTVQFFFLVCSLVCIYDACSKLGFNRETSWFAVIIGLTVPSILLQASTTMNDLTAGYFILTSCYFAVLSLASRSLVHLAALGLSCALAIATKGTSYLLLFPIGAAWFISFVRKYRFTRHSIIHFGVPLLMLLMINGGFWARNYSLSHNVLGGADDGYFITDLGVRPLFSNMVRNIALHASIYPINKLTLSFCGQLLTMLGIDPSDPKTTFGDGIFALAKWGHHEDNAGAAIHLLLVFISAAVLFIKKDRLRYGYLLVLALFTCLLFLKWQPWSTKFHIPLFMLSATLIAAASRYGSGRLRMVIMCLVLAYGGIVLLFNPTRPLWCKPPLTANISLSSPWKQKYYANTPYTDAPDTDQDFNFIDSMIGNEQTVGLDLTTDIWEYPLMVDSSGRIYRNMVFINAKNYTAKLQPKPHGPIRYFLSDKDSASVRYEQRTYDKIAQRKKLFIYKSE